MTYLWVVCYCGCMEVWQVIVLGFIHWGFVLIALKGIAETGKTKWVLPVLLLNCVGPLAYLILNPVKP